MSHFVGFAVHEPSIPEEIVSPPLPLAWFEIQPSPIASSAAASGSGPTCVALAAPWHFPNVWPPAISATVS